jgi:tRNA pseudouridine synthase 9
MPVHVSGQYRKNTLLSIVEAEHPEFGTLLPVHRLDKSVSGVLLFARSKVGAENMRHLIQVQYAANSYNCRFPLSDCLGGRRTGDFV